MWVFASVPTVQPPTTLFSGWAAAARWISTGLGWSTPPAVPVQRCAARVMSPGSPATGTPGWRLAVFRQRSLTDQLGRLWMKHSGLVTSPSEPRRARPVSGILKDMVTPTANPFMPPTSVTVQLPPETERALREKAASAGLSLEAYLQKLAQRDAENGTPRAKTLDEILTPIREGFAESGMSEDELTALF